MNGGYRMRTTMLLAVATVTLAVAVLIGVLIQDDPHRGAASPNAPARDVFYVDPDTAAAQWVDTHPDDVRAAAITSSIVRYPQAIWFANYDPEAIGQEVAPVVAAAAREAKIPVLVVYEIPVRDCGGPSSGGAPDAAGYRLWIDNFAAGLDGQPAWVILEPDALALMGCLTGEQRQQRYQLLAYAARTLRSADPNLRLYVDAGHSGWIPVATMATRLRAVDVTALANGLSLNVGNFEPTQREVAYGGRLIRALGDRSLHLVVDTGRNGDGSGSSWCDPPGRALGPVPTSNTRSPSVDALLWVKPPGEADGCLAAPGTFLPEYAYQLLMKRGVGLALVALAVGGGRCAYAVGNTSRRPGSAPPTAAPAARPLPQGPLVALDVAGPLAVGPNGHPCVADVARDRVVVRLPDSRSHTVAGTGQQGFSGDGAPAVDAELTDVSDLATAADGTLYIADGARVRAAAPPHRRGKWAMTRPDTIIRSAWRGDAWKISIPNRARSKLAVPAAISSIPQHASPKLTGHMLRYRAHFTRSSRVPVRKLWWTSSSAISHLES
jgi:endoglucanase